MSLTASIHRNGAYLFAAFIPFAIVAFGYNFFVRELSSFVTVHHLHGVAMFAWMFLLVAQASLIRMGNRELHRQLGKTSYVLMPFIAISTVMLAHHTYGERAGEQFGGFLLALQIFLLLQLLIIYGNAIRHRKSPDVHARWMVGTIMPMIDPIFARIIGNFISADIPSTLYTFGGTNLLIIGLIVWDWKAHSRRDVFVPLLIICLATQIPVLALFASAAWSEVWTGFGSWFLSLPL
ncbi:MAG: hypothetical protein GKR91_15305 [Pseudomonadales bacterium]|nr:hypothetical protein [Pseudomonadales bacterium]